MSLEFRAKGTIVELEKLFHWDILCLMISVDYYNRHRVPDAEVFTITEQHLAIAGLIPRQTNNDHS